MTNSQPSEDISTKLAEIDSCLEQLGDEINSIRTIQEGLRRENRPNSRTLARLEKTVADLADIAQLHQKSFRLHGTQIEEFQHTTNVTLERIDRALDYLLKQSGGQSEGN